MVWSAASHRVDVEQRKSETSYRCGGIGRTFDDDVDVFAKFL